MKPNVLEERLEHAITACKSAGKSLLAIRGTKLAAKLIGDQLKSEADMMADKLVKAVILDKYPGDLILSEETYDDEKNKFSRANKFWILDPLDGTKSFFEGFNGFCVQIAFFAEEKLQIGVVYSPSDNITYSAISKEGAFVQRSGKMKKLHTSDKLNTYIESRKARGKVSEILEEIGADRFLECGSYGLKICRVAEGIADVFLKDREFKIWDVAPGDLILSESGGRLTTWFGENINYRNISFNNLLACSEKNNGLILSKTR